MIKTSSVLTIFSLFAFALTVTDTDAAESLVQCDTLAVHYDEPRSKLVHDLVSVQALKQRPSRILVETNPEFISESPQQTAAFNRVLKADTMKPGPYANTIDIFSTKGKPVTWRLQFNDLNDNVRLTWINEELIFIQLWLGRIVSTDLIFEIRSGRFIYAKEANYGLLIEPCE